MVSHTNVIDFVSKLNFFINIDKMEINTWLESAECTVLSYKKGDIVYLENDACKTMDIVMSGMVSLQKIDENGNVLTIANFTKTDVLGANLLFSANSFYHMTSTCLKDCVLIKLTKNLVLRLCQNNQDFLCSFLGLLSDKTLYVTGILHNIAHKSIRDMIITFLRNEFAKQKSSVIKLNITKQELAEKFGIQRPSLSRELNKMRSTGLVEYDSKSITICDLNIINNQ